MAITTTDVVSEYGSYYLKEGQNMQSLRKELYRPSKTAGYFAPRPTQNTVYRLAQAELTRVIQPFQKKWSPTGDITFTPNPIQLFKIKIDNEEYPDDIAETWLGFLEGEGVDRTQWPFVRWFIEQHLLPRARQDMELNEIFSGTYTAPTTAGTAGAVKTAMNGIKKLQDDLVTDGRITVINTGDPADADGAGAGTTAMTDQEWYEAVEAWQTSVPEKYRRLNDFIFMSEDLELKFRRGKRAKYNTNYLQEPNLETVADFPNAKAVGLPSHSGSKRIWTTLPEVRVRPIKKASLANTMKVDAVDRLVKMYTDWYEGVGFTVPEMVFVNEQD